MTSWKRVWEKAIAPAIELPFPPEECGALPRVRRREAADADQDAFNRLYLPTIFTRPTTKIHRAIDEGLLSNADTCLWAPRGIGKSVRALAVVLRRLLMGEVWYVLYLMKSEEKAVEALEELHDGLHDNPKIAHDYDYTDAQLTGTRLEVKIQGKWRCIQAFGMGGSIRGSKYKSHRPDIVVIDDPHKDEEARNPERLVKTWTWLRRNIKFLGELGKRAPVKILMTRVAEEDLFGQHEQARRTAFEEGRPYPWQLVGLPIAEPDGTSNIPEIMSAEEIQARRLEDPEAVDQEWFGIPADRKKKYFPEEGFVFYEPADLVKLRIRKRMSVDPSLGRNSRSDTSCVLVVGYTASTPREYYVLEASIERRPPQEIAGAMFEVLLTHRDLERIVVEDVGFQEAAILPELIRLAQDAGIELPIVELYRPTEDKDARVGLATRPHKDRRIHYFAGHRAFVQQCQRYPQPHAKDGPDAFAQFLITLGAEQFAPLKIEYTPLLRRRDAPRQVGPESDDIRYGDTRERSAW